MRPMTKTTKLFGALLALAPAAAFAQALVAPTGPLTPEEQQKKFHLPPGFEIQLVASEPDVNKPMNLEFDAHGRLWVTHSLEYPFPAKDPAKARDAITIFSELDAGGRAKKVQRFAEGLNIPIGVLPLSDTDVVAWSIPNIFRLTDTNNDGVADAKSVVLGPFDIKDTHGNQNSFTRWVDGWVYANHGFNNDSKPKLHGEGDKPVMQMQSGHTYRFRADGSAAEIFSYGQVNPFGLSFDPLGNVFTADCHSRAVTMLLREAYYQSFGKPHDGLGYGPDTTDIDHGGTGIAGVVYYAADAFPKAFRDVLFIGNVITNRVHFDRLKWTGSSPRVESVNDFLTCDDPWFRPVDIQLGPDGALYVADFYNKIIGHYEVPLTHPERDRERGRIWRIAYTGKDVDRPAPMPDLTAVDAPALAAQLRSGNLTVRTLATNTLLDRFPAQAASAAAAACVANGDGSDAASLQRAHGLWVTARTVGIDEPLAKQLASDAAPVVRVHLVKALGEAIGGARPWHGALLRGAAADADPFVRRAAAEAMAKQPAGENVPVLLKLIRETDEGDVQLVHAARIALRDQLRDDAVATAVAKLRLDGPDEAALLGVAAVTPGDAAAALVFEAAVGGRVPDDTLARVLPAAARKVDASRADSLVELVTTRFAGRGEFQTDVLRNLFEGLASRGAAPTPKMTAALSDLLRPAVAGDPAAAWTNLPVPGAPKSDSPWFLETRHHEDSRDDQLVASSLKERNDAGERRTGILRSPAFTLPPKLSFWVCGHNGPPGEKDLGKNFVRVVLADGTEVARVAPPRNDVAQPRSFDLSAHAGKTGHVEVVDGCYEVGAWGWLAVSRFDPAVIRVPQRGAIGDPDAARASAIRLAGSTRLAELTDDVLKACTSDGASADLRVAGAEALLTLRPDAAVAPLTAVLSDGAVPVPQRQQAAQFLSRVDGRKADVALLSALRSAPQPVAVAIASAVAGSKDGAAALLDEIGAGKASPTLLREPTVLDRLRDSGVADLDRRVAQLTAKLSPADDRIATLIADRKAGYLKSAPDAAAGKAVFVKSVCAQCHKLGDAGGQIGPALDGIGNRGLDRLLEDVLDPNRNVDQAFRTTIVRTKKGQTYAGFNVREEGETLVMNDTSGGKEVRIPLADIDRKQASTLSPMPANVDQLMPESDFQQLMAYLLSSRVK